MTKRMKISLLMLMMLVFYIMKVRKMIKLVPALEKQNARPANVPVSKTVLNVNHSVILSSHPIVSIIINNYILNLYSALC